MRMDDSVEILKMLDGVTESILRSEEIKRTLRGKFKNYSQMHPAMNPVFGHSYESWLESMVANMIMSKGER